ncbi:alpha/beta-hydrolase [Stereum hirsutum FP-91666 SS1]|uniref:alpha/beta-hydrolase n=1 Tax=Stereum hirsutum (strain FP-91666) TaxID=721885 RepID=UPI0004449BC2|nr:alpha/beta-hydrolase [Stereum hirsutum FP-91666 SS1]EIM86952.1 alpha/beta-hydrolase [Stereum hirsutum FP-91666 SS1]
MLSCFDRAFWIAAGLLALSGRAARASVIPEKRQSITTLSSTAVADFLPYTYFAAAAYCPSSSTVSWTCGTLCDENSDFKITTSGGDGAVTQFWYVGWSPSLETVVVAHQGTNTSFIVSDLEDIDFFFQNLDGDLFPGVDSGIEVHMGFSNDQAKSGPEILAAVNATMTTYNSKTITTIGHSLGAALAMLDAVMFTTQFPDASVNHVGYGQPRVGNQDFADYVDANVNVTHINNKLDYIPILPGMFLGFHHPSGEIRIQDDDSWDSCPGQDNESTLCTTGAVPDVFAGNETDHDGPYGGVLLGFYASATCTVAEP